MAATEPLTADSGVINSTGTTSYRNAETLGSVLHRNSVSVQVNRSRKSGGGGGPCRGGRPRHPNTGEIGLLKKMQVVSTDFCYLIYGRKMLWLQSKRKSVIRRNGTEKVK